MTAHEADGYIDHLRHCVKEALELAAEGWQYAPKWANQKWSFEEEFRAIAARAGLVTMPQELRLQLFEYYEEGR